MTAQDMAKAIGRTVWYHADGYLDITVQVIDARTRYGNVDYLITPLNGRGEKWVSDNKVSFDWNGDRLS